ncbi:MAG: putative acyl-CoA synthetase YngI, partial [Actinomycetia bacterium]|nr:putative acyl-CoA synthetase YngI [Actinomycetes bacterium]
MISYASGTSQVALLGETIGENLERTVARFGAREALVDGPRRWTYAELNGEVDAVALGLLDLGVGTGDRVGIWAPNCAEWVFAQYATAKIGAILVNINPAYRVHELQYVLTQAGIRTLIATPSFKTSDYAAMIEEVRPSAKALRDVLLIG